MPGYTFGDYIYFNNMTDEPNEHHNHLILNQNPFFKLYNITFEVDR